MTKYLCFRVLVAELLRFIHNSAANHGKNRLASQLPAVKSRIAAQGPQVGNVHLIR